MVDASIVGKLGVDLDHLKNQIGIVANPLLVLIEPHFLQSLSNNQLVSGYAEMLKHGLIKNKKYFKELIDFNFLDGRELIEKYIYQSIVIKNEVVKNDTKELGERKLLNFGHTLGHAIESYFLKQKIEKKLLHGEAIAVGMILESFISVRLNDLSLSEANYIAKSITKIYTKIEFLNSEIAAIISLVRYDKKNINGENRFTLLSKIGEANINNSVSVKLMELAFDMYKSS